VHYKKSKSVDALALLMPQVKIYWSKRPSMEIYAQGINERSVEETECLRAAVT
jgi:hypothetical protein